MVFSTLHNEDKLSLADAGVKNMLQHFDKF